MIATVLHCVSAVKSEKAQNRVFDQEYRKNDRQEQRVQANQNAKPKPQISIEDQINASRVPIISTKGKFFEPIEMKFPDTSQRTDVEAQNYVNELMEKIPKYARKEDPNLKMTGKRCARGLGSLYEV